MTNTIGFIGFGEVASILARHLCEQNATVFAYDVLLDRDDGKQILESRRQGAPVRLTKLETVISNSHCIISAVPTHLAQGVAETCTAHLAPSHVYVDVNSTAPWVKVAIGKVVESSKARFVEGAVLGAVGATGAATKILLGGPHASEIAIFLNNLGLNTTPFSHEIGKASVFKMLRSIFSKGMEAILVEALLAGAKAGVAEELWRDFTDTLEKAPFSKVADNWIRSHGTACERRYHEMELVLETMSGYGVAPVVTAGTTEFFKRSTELGLHGKFQIKPETKEQVIGVLATLLE